MTITIIIKNKIKLRLAIIIIIILAIISIFSVKLFSPNKLTVKQIYEKSFSEITNLDPENALVFGIPQKYISEANKKTLTDISLKAIEHRKEVYKYWLNEIKKIDYSKQTQKDKLNIDILKWYLNDSLTQANLSDYQYIINSMCGVQIQTPVNLMNCYKINNKENANNYLVCLTKFKDKFNQAIQRLENSKKNGLIPPQITINNSIEEMNKFISDDSENNMLYVSFYQKVSALKISKQEKAKLYKKAKNEINNIVYPAYKKLINFCSSLLSKSSDNLGLCNYKGGREYYSSLIHSIGTNMTPDEVYNLGMKRVKQIQVEIKNFKLKYNPKTSSNFTSTTAKGVKQRYQQILDNANKKMSKLFDLKPKNPLAVKEMTDLESEYDPPHYVPGSTDESTPGTLYYSLLVPLNLFEDLSYHEGIPGHHFQLSIQQQLKSIPELRKFIVFNAFLEGWATYAERLSYENGLYTDSSSKLGFLEIDLYSALSLVADIGINYKGWSSEKAIEFGVENGSDLAGQIPRITEYPGQLVSYTLGETKILELREKAKRELGNKFNLKEFHDVILENGSVPLDILDRIVDQYIDSNK